MDGYTGDTYCKDCNARIESGQVIAGTGKHAWNQGRDIKSPTCTEKGEKEYTCTTGYQIQISSNKKFAKKAAVTKTVKKNSTTKLTVNKLKPKKKYYVRVRTYKVVKGKKYCSSWSKSKTVTTKK